MFQPQLCIGFATMCVLVFLSFYSHLYHSPDPCLPNVSVFELCSSHDVWVSSVLFKGQVKKVLGYVVAVIRFVVMKSFLKGLAVAASNTVLPYPQPFFPLGRVVFLPSPSFLRLHFF